MTSKQLQLLIT